MNTLETRLWVTAGILGAPFRDLICTHGTARDPLYQNLSCWCWRKSPPICAATHREQIGYNKTV